MTQLLGGNSQDDAARARHKRRIRAWIVGLLGAVGAVVILAYAVLSPPDSADSNPVTTLEPAKSLRAPGFNVLLISMDTTRADHLGCYGHPDVRTPNIDRIAEKGTLFTQCTTTAPMTLPSHASMMTGTYPFVHGARDNGQYHVRDDNETLAEILSAHGYFTSAEVAAFVLNREFGLNQGFDQYHDTYADAGLKTPSPHDLYAERTAGQVCDGAIATLRRHSAERFFMFVHFFDPHQPYDPPMPFAEQYREPYLGEIAYVDEQIGRLFSELRSLGLDDQTLVIITSDHGEGLGQHDEATHMVFVYDTTLTVPLIIWCPERIPAGLRLTSQVRTIDIAPTIVSFLGLSPMRHAQGVDLLPLIAAPTLGETRLAYAESLVPLLNLDCSALRAVRAEGWKYIHAPRPELYNVVEDPGELRNLAVDEPDRVERMRRQLYELVESVPRQLSDPDALRELSAAEIEKLQSLGYVSGGTTDSAVSELTELELLANTKPDPKDHIDEINLTIDAMAMKSQGDFQEAEKLLRTLLAVSTPERSESLRWAQTALAGVLEAQDRNEEAIECYRKILRHHPKDGTTLTSLALTLGNMGRIDQAITEFRKALLCEPVLARTHRGYGTAMWKKRDTHKAVRHFKLAVALDPTFRGYSFADELAWILCTFRDDALRDGREAVRLAEMACDGTGRRNPSMLDTLAAAYAETGRFDDAMKTAEHAIRLSAESGNRELAKRIQRRLELYQAHQPCRDR